jgi:hypothetical protein
MVWFLAAYMLGMISNADNFSGFRLNPGKVVEQFCLPQLLRHRHLAPVVVEPIVDGVKSVDSRLHELRLGCCNSFHFAANLDGSTGIVMHCNGNLFTECVEIISIKLTVCAVCQERYVFHVSFP